MQQSHICEESEAFNIHSWILRFSQIYMLFVCSQPHAHNNNVSPKFELHLSVLTMKMYPILRFVVQFSDFLLKITELEMVWYKYDTTN
jgi:hypothetical protein